MTRLTHALGFAALIAASGCAHAETPSKTEAQKAPRENPTAIAPQIETLIPKRELGVVDFLKQYPEYDGRGVVIAVFDTGVDPGAAGLQVTSTGDQKIIDLIDATGSGDVDVATTATLSQDGTLAGLTGRTLKLPKDLKNPSGEFRLGWKAYTDILNRGVQRRLNRVREEEYDKQLRELRATRHRQRLEDEASGKRPAASKADADLTQEEKDLLAKEKMLEELEDGYLDRIKGPVFDCVVWNDGKEDYVLLDTDEDGDLGDEKAIRPFPVAHEYATFQGDAAVNYGVQLYEDGKLLSIVTSAGSHGTNVASIAAACDPENPARNGIAPGAQVISIRIGDIRLGSSSPDIAYVRAAAAVAKAKADVVNISYGGATTLQDAGDFTCEILDKLVSQYNVTIFSSMGNEGPALSTAGSPGGEARRVISVGAYVSPEMAKALHQVNGDREPTAYDFTSRGPNKGGDLAVDIFAPGGAMGSGNLDGESVNEFMNGTSQASPNAAGVACLMISGAKKLGLKTTPARVRAAMMNTAKSVDGIEVWAQGPGLAQAGPAFEHLRKYQDIAAFDLFFEIESSYNDVVDGGGLYLRNGHKAGEFDFPVTVRPLFPATATSQDKYNLQEELTLQSTKDWLKVPSFLHMTNSFESLRPIATIPAYDEKTEQAPLYAEVQGVPARAPEAGPLFRIPVTIVQPMKVSEEGGWRQAFTRQMKSGELARRFYLAPDGATVMRFRMRLDPANEGSRVFVIHSVALSAVNGYYSAQAQEHFRLQPGEEREIMIPVYGGRTVELVINQHWTSLGNTSIAGSVEFIGVDSESNVLTMMQNQGYDVYPARSVFSDLTLDASASITDAVYEIVPVKSEIIPLDERATWPAFKEDTSPVKNFACLQTFEIQLEEETSFTQSGNGAQELVKEGYDGSMTQYFHESGEWIANVAGWGERKFELPKGKITAYRSLESFDLEYLERHKADTLVLKRALRPAANMSTFDGTRNAAAARSASSITLQKGIDAHVVIGDSALDSIKKMEPVPSFYEGEFKLSKDNHDFVSIPIIYQKGEKMEEDKKDEAEKRGKEKPKTGMEKLKEDLYDTRLEFLKTMRTKNAKSDVTTHTLVLEELLKERPDDERLYYEQAIALASRAKLLSEWNGGKSSGRGKGGRRGRGGRGRGGRGGAEAAEAAPASPNSASDEKKEDESKDSKDSKDSKESKDEKKKEDLVEPPDPALIFEAIEKARTRIDADAVARFLGAHPVPAPGDRDAEDELSDEEKKMDEKRTMLRDLALLESDVLMNQKKLTESRAALQEAYRWASDPSSEEMARQEAGQLEAEGYMGLALEHFREAVLAEDPYDKGNLEKLIAFYKKLGWDKWADLETQLMERRKNQKQPTL